ncbi:integrase arm-type DNA-binding domain-containing protein [Rhodanobacter sp. C05]|uniref:tyrosine-type recombinase/integrase n=1 Tax=Rhodanobacter sp. C05 TaxID=1945855 RepID=UPI0009877DA7|nr:integrase arm-type DNA-binding domain-containing protein [Rhodanobacter sp. C05]OOG38181.1 integrase [Rhodanobacter sp. C05]
MLTPSAVANAKPQGKPYKLADERGMYLLVKPDGARWWRFDYRRPDTRKRNTLSMGTFPDVSLRKARERRDEARKLLADGIDPGNKRKAETLADADTFEAVAREWFAKFSPKWAASHADKVIRRLERDVFPWIGTKPMAKLEAPDVLAVLRRIESRNAVETAHRAHQNCGQVFRYAVATGRAKGDVTRDLRGSLTPWKAQHYASITEPGKVGDLLRAIDGFTGSYVVAALLKLSPLVFTRPGEVREMEWPEIDLDAGEWNIPAERMKLRLPHVVPLAPQAVAILRELHPLTGKGRYVFPGARSIKRPLSNMTVNAALRRMGYDKDTMTAHGFRAIARTILDEVLGFRVDIIEHQLAHAVKDANGRAYNRTSFLPQRRKMMDAWADYLDTLKAGDNVVPIMCKAS